MPVESSAIYGLTAFWGISMKAIHPFPARMAPEILQEKIPQLGEVQLLWDPMCGSGTSLRVAAAAGIPSVGTDVDPLAIKMARVGTRNFDPWELTAAIELLWERIERRPKDIKSADQCAETDSFKQFWFAQKQRDALATVSHHIALVADRDLREFFEIALSRIIITKFRGASLAWDVSHSRPHRAKESNDFDVRSEFLRSCRRLALTCMEAGRYAQVDVEQQDARTFAPNAPVDLIVTSPPYLNAIDYMRGHKLSLVWLGWTIPELRALRSGAIGTERSLANFANDLLSEVEKRAVVANGISNRMVLIVRRYIRDCAILLQNMRLRMASTAQLLLVVADSNVRGLRVDSARLFQELARQNGLRLVEETQRAIPANRRYLPANDTVGIGNRMKSESILHFAT